MEMRSHAHAYLPACSSSLFFHACLSDSRISRVIFVYSVYGLYVCVNRIMYKLKEHLPLYCKYT